MSSIDTRGDMHNRSPVAIICVALAYLMTQPLVPHLTAQGWTAGVKSLRCTFVLNATGTWKKEGTPQATVVPSNLVLTFDAINLDEGTARLRTGSVGSDLVAKLSSGYLHFIQSFRTGSLYTTTVF